ncbi:phasin family protein [uncultured Vibrio sp.]|uniref:phasin family protein n=1 Tax=uncultured Vibrio sp. TaxID=114054 RepID=UPI00261A49C5|nr:phasin family protein [uncultured Vibrio sp.]
MYTDIFKTMTDQTEKQFEPYFKFNKLVAKNVQTLAELQMDAMQTYTDMGLAQMKAVSEIKDVNSLTAFNSQQLSTLTQLSQQMMSDSAKLQAVAKEFKEDVETLTTENLKTVTPA